MMKIPYRGGPIPLTSDEMKSTYEIRSALGLTLFDTAYLNSDKLLVIASSYLHIDLARLEIILNRKLIYSRAYKDRDKNMRYEFKIEDNI